MCLLGVVAHTLASGRGIEIRSSCGGAVEITAQAAAVDAASEASGQTTRQCAATQWPRVPQRVHAQDRYHDSGRAKMSRFHVVLQLWPQPIAAFLE